MKRGSITISLSILLPLFLSVIMASVFSAKVRADRVQLANGMDQALYSALAQYDRDLLERYDLFFLDGACGSGTLRPEKLAARIEDAMNAVLLPERGIFNLGAQRLYALSVSEPTFTGMSLMSDFGGRVFEAQAIAFMRESTGIGSISRLLELQDHAGQEEPAGTAAEILSRFKNEEGAALPEELPAADAAEGEESAAEESVSEAERTRGEEALSFLRKLCRVPVLEAALPAGQSLSGKTADLSAYASRRPLQKGFGVTSLTQTDFGRTDRLLYKAYLTRHFGSFRAPMAEGELSYQQEYLIGGGASDEENLTAVLSRILLLREGVNLLCLLSDTEKLSQAKALSELTAGLLLNPELAPVIEVLLLGTWAYGESVVDLRALLLGKRIAPVKTAENWQLSLEHLPRLLNGGAEGLIRESPAGLSYEDFLALFLLAMETETLTPRALDMIEATLRGAGRPSFCVDTQIFALSMEVCAKAEGMLELSGEKQMSYADLA